MTSSLLHLQHASSSSPSSLLAELLWSVLPPPSFLSDETEAPSKKKKEEEEEEKEKQYQFELMKLYVEFIEN